MSTSASVSTALREATAHLGKLQADRRRLRQLIDDASKGLAAHAKKGGGRSGIITGSNTKRNKWERHNSVHQPTSIQIKRQKRETSGFGVDQEPSTMPSTCEGKVTKTTNDVDSGVDGGQQTTITTKADSAAAAAIEQMDETKKRPRDAKADSKVDAKQKKQRSFQANLFGNLFFKHLQKAKSSLDHDKDQLLRREKVVNRVQDKLRESTTILHGQEKERLESQKVKHQKELDFVVEQLKDAEEKALLLRRISRLEVATDQIQIPTEIDDVTIYWKPARHTRQTQKLLEKSQKELADQRMGLQDRIRELDRPQSSSSHNHKKVADEREVANSSLGQTQAQPHDEEDDSPQRKSRQLQSQEVVIHDINESHLKSSDTIIKDRSNNSAKINKRKDNICEEKKPKSAPNALPNRRNNSSGSVCQSDDDGEDEDDLVKQL